MTDEPFTFAKNTPQPVRTGKRGRPRLIRPEQVPVASAAADTEPVEPQTGSPAHDGETEALARVDGAGVIEPVTEKKRRGRPPGSKNKNKMPEGRPDRAKVYYDNKTRATSRTVAEWMALRAMNPQMSNKEIAKAIGISVDTLYKALQRARKEGTLQLHDPMEQLKYNLIPKAVENLDGLLQAKDKKATLETMKGTLFPAYRAEAGVAEMPNMVLAIKVEMPENFDQSVQAVGTMVGKPRELKEIIDVIDVTPES